MHLTIALSLLMIFTSAQSVQDRGKGTGESDKTSATSHNSKKKIYVPPTSVVALQGETSEQHLDNNQNEREESKKPIHDWIDLLNSISTAVVAAFTIVMVCVVYSQNRATKLTERAWVVADFESPPPYSPDKTIRFAWTLINLGKTPAWITEMSVPQGQVLPARGELPPKPPYKMKSPFPKEGSPMTPKATLIQFVWVASEQQAKIEIGELVFYIFGTIKYRDIFGGKHETQYCFRFNPALGGADPATRDFVLAEQPGYNRTT